MSGLVLRDVVVTRGQRTVLQIAALHFPANSITAILGPNGAGKTTLLRTIAGLESGATGLIDFAGGRVQSRLHVALAMQESVFLRGSVESNLRLGLELRRVPDVEIDTRVAAIADECRLHDLLGRPARRLSVGEAQRVNLARALVLDAPVILLDEPLGAVDRAGRRQLMDELPGLLRRRQAVVLLVTHDREEALELADRLVLLEHGRVLAADSTRALMSNPPSRAAAELLGYTVIRLGDRDLALPQGALSIRDDGGVLRGTALHVFDAGPEVRVRVRLDSGVVYAALPSGVMPPAPGQSVGIGIRHDGSVPVGGPR